jgi:hypothetical protein
LQHVAGQRCNNVASYSVPGHHCSVARSCSVAPPPAIAATAVELYTFDVSRTFVGRLPDFSPTFVGRTSTNFRPQTFVRRTSVLRTAYVTTDITTNVLILLSYAQRPAILRHVVLPT